jgi:hypothetical protein
MKGQPTAVSPPNIAMQDLNKLRQFFYQRIEEMKEQTSDKFTTHCLNFAKQLSSIIIGDIEIYVDEQMSKYFEGEK